MRKRVIMCALAAFAAVAMFAPRVEAANRFAMTCIENKTDITLKYRTQWGNGQWEHWSVNPGARNWHTWKYDRPNENASPVLHVSFDGDLSSRMYNQQYKLESYASPQQGDCERYGKIYRFRYDGSARKYIDLRRVD